ncbi:hypothetical protein IMSHALPRED_003099 [Imshaugia aleurites]|uniref:RNase III domain-containing protein n=1 Tax=Imshaugia aleurites TaxID=172621 RepID=A0A8H3J720_9LECA|nr:hypothetical protein IMSHALPRED_003099 [Imshaugia aleurites]
MAPTVRKLQSRIGYNFKNVQYLWEAVQAPGAIIRSGEVEGAGTERHSVGFQRFPDGNRRLAVLGDTVLKLALVDDWYKGTEVRERLSRVVSDVGSNANLNMVGRTNGLDTLINKNPADKDAPVGAVTMAGTIEAILGAVYLDSDMKCVTEVMQNLALMPRLVRRTGMKVPMSDSMKSPVASTPSVQDQGEPETAPRDLDESLVKVMKSSQELEKAMREHSIVMQLKQRLDQNAQSTP